MFHYKYHYRDNISMKYSLSMLSIKLYYLCRLVKLPLNPFFPTVSFLHSSFLPHTTRRTRAATHYMHSHRVSPTCTPSRLRDAVPVF